MSVQVPLEALYWYSSAAGMTLKCSLSASSIVKSPLVSGTVTVSPFIACSAMSVIASGS